MRSACIVDAASVGVTPDCLTYCAPYIISLCELGGKSGVGVSKRGMMPYVGAMYQAQIPEAICYAPR